MATSASARIFVTGTGTGIGKTVVSAILAEALGAAYWKPVQAGTEEVTDSEWVRTVLTRPVIYPESYRLRIPASPHIAARAESTVVDLQKIMNEMAAFTGPLVIEGAGGLLAPLNEEEFVIDLIRLTGARPVLVSRNMLGSINHSLLTALACKQAELPVLGWIFNDVYLDYEKEIANWSGFPRLASIPQCTLPDAGFVHAQAKRIREQINQWPW